jgi:long-chain acyl-CoA synthetase
VVLKKIKDQICPSMKYMAAGGAGVSMPVLEFFEDIGIPICEGYGLTETAPVITVSTNSFQNRRLGKIYV